MSNKDKPSPMEALGQAMSEAPPTPMKDEEIKALVVYILGGGNDEIELIERFTSAMLEDRCNVIEAERARLAEKVRRMMNEPVKRDHKPNAWLRVLALLGDSAEAGGDK